MADSDKKEINFAKIEEKWQKRWEKEKAFEVTEDTKKKKYYVLEMFPYPSGSGLHMGHAWNYTIGDILARFKIKQGFNVLHPMGYDALGLPAENAAIQAGEHPAKYTEKSTSNFMKQQKKLGLTYDWTRCVNTSKPDYYKWDQWIFLKMYEKGLAYQKEASVNWCPKCDTVLANEQVHEGKCWRHETQEVEIKHLKQWFLKITDYVDRLLDHSKLNWPEKTIAMQKNWIGKSHGTEIDFEINEKKWKIFTTRADTIFGVTFMVISAQHPKLFDIVTKEKKKDVEKFLKKIKSVSQKSMKDIEELDKEGVFTGSYAINPANGDKIPIYAGNFVVADYGSGMVMAVPAHDQRDFEFAKKYNIPIKKVIEGNITHERAYVDEGKLVNSGKFNGINSTDAIAKITDWLIKEKKARKTTNYKLRDWGISRQRYWGAPIPIIHCSKCGVVPVPEKDLPVILPEKVKFGKGNPLETNESWIKVKCPKCGGEGRRETETMDTFVNSSWYFFRYCDAHNKNEIFSKEKAKYWMPIDTYIGGAEHACMHLIYARFYTMFLHDIGLTNIEEFAPRLFHQGMLHAEGGEKMSKSKGNVVLPESVSDKYGIDSARFFLCSLASPDKDIDWSENGIIGSLRFINNIFAFYENTKKGKSSSETESLMNKTIKNVTEYYGNFEYRKATIELRSLFEQMQKDKETSKENLEKFLHLLSPICPHITEELWEKLGNKTLLSKSKWPEFKEIKERQEKQDITEQVISSVREIVNKVEETKEVSKIFIYVMPFELGKIKKSEIDSSFKGKKVQIYAVNDAKKHDPEGKAKKALPGKPGVWVS